MADRIDHAAAARHALNGLGPDMLTDRAAVVVAGAQVHATLALVEQQRISNLIAISANAARMVAEGSADAAHYYDIHVKVNPQVMEGLGL